MTIVNPDGETVSLDAAFVANQRPADIETLATTFNDMSTLTIVTPPLPAGAQRVTIANLDGETVSLAAAFVAT